MSDFSQFTVSKILGNLAKSFIREHHYTHGCHNGPMAWGLFRGEVLVGACAFATPCSENVRKSVFGPEHKGTVTELHRLVVLEWEGRPRNLTSWFVRRAFTGLAEYRPQIRGVLSFADTTQGHTGAIYKALNFLQVGTTGRAWFYRDETGRLRHPRQNGRNITWEEAQEKNWTREKREAKLRFLYLMPQHKREARLWKSRLKLKEVVDAV